MKINRETCKGFWNRNKGAIIAGGGVLLGIVVTAILLNVEKEDVEGEAKALSYTPDRSNESEWKSHCDQHSLLYDSGLPMFADEAKFIIYRDAVEPEDIKLFKEEDGFTIIDREA